MQLGSGTVTRMIGTGGMANIYEIWDSQLEVRRAVKLMHPNLSEDSRRHFHTEMKIMAELSHPNIVEIHSVGQWNDLPYIEMDLIDGVTLDVLLEQRGALPIPVVTSIATIVAQTLFYAHNKQYVIYGNQYTGIIHRDLKPSNVMVSRMGEAKLMDFGIARPVEASLLTTDGALMGTMQYLAPEQLDRKQTDVRTDIYSFGTVLYEMLTGVKAFPQINLSKLMLCKGKNDYRPLRSYDRKIPRSLASLVHKCMMHDMEKRVKSSEQLLALCKKVHGRLTYESPEDILKRFMASSAGNKNVLRVRKRPPLPAIAGGLGLSAGAAGMFILISWLATREGNGHDASAVSSDPVRQGQTVQTDRAIPRPTPPAPRPAAPQPSRASAPKPAPQPSPTPPPEEPSLLDRLRATHTGSSLAEIFVHEAQAGNYRNAEEVFHALPSASASSEKNRILLLRVLSALGKDAQRAEILLGSPVRDGEFYLEKAKLLYSRGRIDRARQALRKALSTPARFLDSSTLRREHHYLVALCASRRFDALGTEEARKAAMDRWFEVKRTLRTMPEHAYFQKAVEEMQRIGRAF